MSHGFPLFFGHFAEYGYPGFSRASDDASCVSMTKHVCPHCRPEMIWMSHIDVAFYRFFAHHGIDNQSFVANHCRIDVAWFSVVFSTLRISATPGFFQCESRCFLRQHDKERVGGAWGDVPHLRGVAHLRCGLSYQICWFIIHNCGGFLKIAGLKKCMRVESFHW